MGNHFGNKAIYLNSLNRSGFNIPAFISVNKNETFTVVLKRIKKELNLNAFLLFDLVLALRMVLKNLMLVTLKQNLV
tara:strand:- start:821 stop:1051 length:231 start_codon:yes stop_codon:yes gene_type:complete